MMHQRFQSPYSFLSVISPQEENQVNRDGEGGEENQVNRGGGGGGVNLVGIAYLVAERIHILAEVLEWKCQFASGLCVGSLILKCGLAPAGHIYSRPMLIVATVSHHTTHC